MKSIKRSKKSSSITLQTSTLTLDPVGGAAALPTVGAPTAPVDLGPVDRGDGRRRLCPQKAQIDQASTAAGELRGSTSFAQYFGAKVPPAETLANNLELCAAWANEAKAAEAWLTYVKRQAALSWDFTLGQLEKMRTPLAAATQLDPSFSTEFPAFSNVVNARSTSSKRAFATRKAKVLAVNKAVADAKADGAPTNGAKAAATPAMTSAQTSETQTA